MDWPIVIVETEEAEEEFFKEVGGKTKIKPASEGGSDEEAEKKGAAKLYHVSDASGKLEIKPVPGALKKELLDTNDCYIVDAQSEGIFVWVGKGSTAQEKKSRYDV